MRVITFLVNESVVRGKTPISLKLKPLVNNWIGTFDVPIRLGVSVGFGLAVRTIMNQKSQGERKPIKFRN